MVFGASGGIGHLAVQLAKRMGARVLAVASGPDGVELVRGSGADAAVDGRRDDVAEAVRAFAPEGLDAALVLVDGRGLERGARGVKKGGRVAYPNGVEPAPRAPDGVEVARLRRRRRAPRRSSGSTGSSRPGRSTSSSGACTSSRSGAGPPRDWQAPPRASCAFRIHGH